VKRLCADDSAATSVKVGYRQASYKEKARWLMSAGFFVLKPHRHQRLRLRPLPPGLFCFCAELSAYRRLR
jgi:hypothetical protein